MNFCCTMTAINIKNNKVLLSGKKKKTKKTKAGSLKG